MDNSQDQIQGGYADRNKIPEHDEQEARKAIDGIRAAEKAHAEMMKVQTQTADLQKVQIRSAALQAALATVGASGAPEVVVSAAIQYAEFLSGIERPPVIPAV